MSTKKTLLQVRTNTNLSVNYKDLSLSPEIELIMLFVEPKYQPTSKGGITKGHELNEFRIKTDTKGISHIIGELQALQAQLTTMENMSEALNVVIKHSAGKPSTPTEPIN